MATKKASEHSFFYPRFIDGVLHLLSDQTCQFGLRVRGFILCFLFLALFLKIVDTSLCGVQAALSSESSSNDPL